MIPSKLAELKALCEKATSGPWLAAAESGEWFVTGPEYAQFIHTKADAEFIAAARTAIPELIAEVERLQGKWDQLWPEMAAHERAHENAQREKHNLREEVERLLAQLAEAREILENYCGPNKMSETEGTLLNRFNRFRDSARAYLEKYPK